MIKLPSFDNGSPDLGQQLMLRVRSGDSEAFDQLVLRYRKRVLAVLESLVNDRARAEELTQEVFLRVYCARDRYRPTSRFTTWLFAIVSNLARNEWRAQARRSRVTSSGYGEDLERCALHHVSLAQDEQDPTRQLDRFEKAHFVSLALDSLSERERCSVQLRYFDNMTCARAAAIMGLSLIAYKALLFRTRKKLRSRLEPYMRD